MQGTTDSLKSRFLVKKWGGTEIPPLTMMMEILGAHDFSIPLFPHLLKSVIALEKGKGLQIEELIKEGFPTEEILKVVKEEKIDLLISLHYQELRFEHFLFCGNIKELIRMMPCSIMLVKNVLKPGEW